MVITITVSPAVEEAFKAKLATLAMTDIKTVVDYVGNLIKTDIQSLVPFVPELAAKEKEINTLIAEKHQKINDLASQVTVEVA